MVRMQNGTATLEDSLAVSYKIKHILAFDPAMTILAIYLLKGVETYLYTNLYMDVSRRFIQIAKTW